MTRNFASRGSGKGSGLKQWKKERKTNLFASTCWAKGVVRHGSGDPVESDDEAAPSEITRKQIASGTGGVQLRRGVEISFPHSPYEGVVSTC